MKPHEIIEYMLKNYDTFPEAAQVSCDPFEIIVNSKEKSVKKKNNAEPLAREKVYMYYKRNGGNFFDLLD